MASNRRLLVIAATVVVLFGATAVAWAVIPDSGGVIHGCYKTNNPNRGQLIVIDSEAGQSCPAGYTPLNWRASGFHGHEIVQAQAFVGQSSRVVVQAVCPTGKVVLGGGGDGAISDQQSPRILRTVPSGTTAWQVIVEFDLPLPDPNNNFANAFAICAFPS